MLSIKSTEVNYGNGRNSYGLRFRYVRYEQSSGYSGAVRNRLRDKDHIGTQEPDVFFEYAKSAKDKGMKVIIAGAGMAAHLPGMFAAIFPLPVIGVPMHTTSLGGRDSLYSIVQMPSGIPVATVAIGGGANAGLLAARMLAISDDKLLAKLEEYSREMEEGVAKKDARLSEVGYKNYDK